MALPTAPAGGLDAPLHRRTIEIDVRESGDAFTVVGRLQDRRPWAEGSNLVAEVHDMELEIEVRRSDLTITAAEARMQRFPHAECPTIEDAFGGLVGLSVGRGYTRAVQERFGRARGCTHLELLARTLGPVVMQAIPSFALRHPPSGGEQRLGDSPMGWLADSCHVWARGGPGEQKLAAGWRPGQGDYPAPSAVDIRRRRAAPEETVSEG